MKIEEEIKQQIKDNNILLYMKGTPDAPECGFSQTVVQALNACGQPYSFVNILVNLETRRVLPSVSDWPTFPQLFIGGELVGGCDIVTELHDNGGLYRLIQRTLGLME
jgi:monothiol glutaredoxin